RLGVKEVVPTLRRLLADGKLPSAVRVEALRALDGFLDREGLRQAAESALRDEQPALRLEGRRVLAKADPGAALGLLEKVLRDGDVPPGAPTPQKKQQADRLARQGAFAILGTMRAKG